MLILSRTKNHQLLRLIVFVIVSVFVSIRGNGQLGISGSTTVNANQVVSYNGTIGGSATASASGTYTFTITGGVVNGGSSTTKSGTISGVIGSANVSVNWNGGVSSGTLRLQWFGSPGGDVTINITIIQPLDPKTLSPSSQSLNYGATATTITGSAATGGAATPNYIYQWQKSSDNVNWTDTSGVTTLNFSPGIMTATTYFRRKVTETNTSTVAYTPSASVIVYPLLACSINPSSQTISNGASAATLVSNASGGNGTYTYQWQSSSDHVSWSDISSGGTSANYSPGGITSTTYYRLKVTSNSKIDTVYAMVTYGRGLGKGLADTRIDTIPLAKDTVHTNQYSADAYSFEHTIRNVLAFKIIEENNKFIPGDFSATVVCKVEYGHVSTSLSTIDSIKLNVNYTKNGGNKYNQLNYFTFNSAEFTRVTIIRVDAPTTVNGVSFDTKQVLLLTNTLAANRFYTMADNVKPVLTIASAGPGPAIPDSVNVSWTIATNTNNNAVQLEWAWVPEDLKVSYMNGGSFDTVSLFKSNSTRIDIPGGAVAGGYSVPLLYGDTGRLYARARVVNLMPSGSRSDGPWSWVQTFGFRGHNDSLNWQATTTFAEEGKRKTVVQYFDGSLRKRQVVTKDNSTQTTVVAETFYDGQGRAAVQVLPAPGINNIIAYTKSLNKFNTQVDTASPLDFFDFSTTTLGKYATSVMDTTRGANLYYSSGNSEKTLTGYNKNIPAANGFAYAVTRYSPDATGRIMMQSGVGDSMQTKYSHAVRYYYGTAAQEELDALFGTEVGNYTHYFKNMAQDANGQMSVSYSDMHGRTVATALAGQNPVTVQALPVTDTSQYKNQVGKSMTRNLLDKGSNILNGTSIESINNILVPFNTQYTFNYNLSKQSLQLPVCSGGTMTYPCKFNLTIDIRDESDTVSIATYNYTGIDTLNFVNAVTLPVGSYSIRKTLTINQDSLAKFLQQYDTLNVGICRSVQALTDSITHYDDSVSRCNLPVTTLTCDSCLFYLGSYSTYLSNYYTSLGDTSVAQLSYSQLEDIRNQYINDSSFCRALNPNTSHTLEAIRFQMLNDMVPDSGQYAIPSGSGTMYNKYNIFSTSGNPNYTQPFYKHPKNEASASDSFRTSMGIADSLSMAKLSTMSDSAFEQAFANSWANALLFYHPEFRRLRFAEDSLRPSFNFIDSLNQTVSTAFNPISSDPYFSVVATGADKNAIKKYSDTSWTNGYSMWQLAYGDAFGCKVYTDTASRGTCYRNMPKTYTTTGTLVNTGLGSVTLSSSIQSQAWNMYKSFYTVARQNMVNQYINFHSDTLNIDTANNRSLISQGFRVYFPFNNVQMGQAAGFGAWFPTDAGVYPTYSLPDSVNKYADHCDYYINQWRLILLQCPALTTLGFDSTTRENVVASITSRMATVCKLGTDDANLYGSSTVSPANSGATFTSFEQLIDHVFHDSLGIAHGLYCNPYGIEYPKPYGLNPTITKRYISAIDTCKCSQFQQIKILVHNSDGDSSSLISVNNVLRGTYKDTITTTLWTAMQSCKGAKYIENCHSGTCDTLYYLPLLNPEPLPLFLDCGFNLNSSGCYFCSNFKTWDTAFSNIFGLHPVFTGTINDTMIAWNNLFAQYVNFKSGLQHNWQFYADTLNKTGCHVGGVTGTDLSLMICLTPTIPITDTAGLIPPVSPCQRVDNNAAVKATNLYNIIQQQLIANFQASYLAKCLAVAETFKVTDTIKEYHYTLYYYDQAGSLIKTVPPKGINPVYRQTWLDSVEAAKLNGTQLVPAHTLITRYCFNSLNQVNIQKSPDGGVSKFYYDRLGRLTVSQNAKQNGAGKVYSYTLYDSIGRITEVGQITADSTMSDAISKDSARMNGWFTRNTTKRSQITQTVYDTAYAGFTVNPTPVVQQHLRNRVSFTQVSDTAANGMPNNATYFSYDIHGNVDTLIQDFGSAVLKHNLMNWDWVADTASGNRFKKIVYDFDIISGKVNQVSYQPGQTDAYYHKYKYDAENRLTDVYSARDSAMLLLFQEREAHYYYYKHGPLARTEIGQLTVQGLDYAYTIQGWLKGINPTMGGTLTNGTDTTELSTVGQDVYGFSLDYYNNDYRAIGYTPQTTTVIGALSTNAAPLYNGNIAAMAVNIPKLSATRLYNYHYDQLNRLVAMDMYTGLNPNTGSFTAANDTSYKERITYDPNGNILKYLRNGDLARPKMDNLAYFYKANTNQLDYVYDTASDASGGTYPNYNDIKTGQTSGTYQYDAIGNLISNGADSITFIKWNVYGKIDSITKNGSGIKYIYDASGNRIMKRTSTDTTIYVRDATGNVLSVYDKPSGGTLVQAEMHIYGSSRLGMAIQHTKPDTTITLSGGFANGIKSIFTRGEKLFELSNHLSNVLVTVTDRRIQVDGNSDGTVDSYTADISSANDYYPFGMQMPGRKFTASSGYRYGFNGKELDKEQSATTTYDYGFRIYNPALGRFLSVDPISKKYPELTPYQFASSSPIDGIDQDGMEWAPPRDGNGNVDNKACIEYIHAEQQGGKGVYESAKETVVGLYNVVRHPINTVNGLWHTITHPIATFKALKQSFVEEFEKDPAKASGKLTGDIFQLFFGGELLKGLSKAKDLSIVGKDLATVDEILDVSKGISTRGLLEDYALTTDAYKSFRNVNIPGGAQNHFYDLINDATRDVVDVTSTTAKELNASQFYSKLDNLASRIADPTINNRVLQVFVKEGQYSVEQLSKLSQKLDAYIKDFNLQKTTFKITPIK